METESSGSASQNVSSTKHTQVSVVTTKLSSLSINHEFKKTYFPFMDLPPEIRNKIYAFAFTMSRSRDAIYDIPDFIVHGHGKNRGGIRWKNVENFYLILTCKKVFLEAIPIISAEAFMEIKVYIDESPRRRKKKANAAYETLKRTAPLCQDVKKVVLNVTPTDFDIDFREDEQLLRIAGVLKDYKKLEEVTLKVRPSSIASTSWLPLVGFFFLVRQGVSLCFELLDYAIEGDEDQDMIDAILEERKDAEDKIKSMSDNYGGDKPNIWVEWNIVEDNREYY